MKQAEKEFTGLSDDIVPPDLLLILGTDASGKNYMANFIANMIEKAGHPVEKREGGFSKPASDALSSEDKSRLELWAEKLFLSTFRLVIRLIYPVLYLLIQIDLKRFRPSSKKVIVISHTPIRILAFLLGHRFTDEASIRLPGYLDRTLKQVIPATNARTIVLDIAADIRKKRIARRAAQGKMDNFDRYMALDEKRSERIEAFLVHLCQTYFSAVKIDNNDLNDSVLAEEVNRAFAVFQQVGGNKMSEI